MNLQLLKLSFSSKGSRAVDHTVSLHRFVQGCAAVLVLALLTTPAQAQLWPKKKKVDQNTFASSQSNSNSSDTATSSATALQTWKGPKLRLAVMDLNGSAFKTQGMAMPQMAVPQAVPQVMPQGMPQGMPQMMPLPTPSGNSIAIPAPADFARGLTEMLTTSLLKTNRFVVLERAVMDKVLGEQDFGAGGRVAKESAAGQGKVLGAQAIVTGDITEFSYTQSSVGGKFSLLKGIGTKLDKVSALVAIDIRVIDAVTGQVLASQRSEGKATMSNLSAEILQGGQDFNVAAAENTPLGQASRQALQGAVNTIANGMQKERWSARVIDFRDGLLYINAGSDIGVQSGLEIDVFRPQEALVDPDTGQSLGAPDRKTGSATVQSAQAKYAVAKVSSGSDFKRGDVVRLKGDAQHD